MDDMLEYKKFVKWARGSLGTAVDDWESASIKLVALEEAKMYIEKAERLLLLREKSRREAEMRARM